MGYVLVTMKASTRVPMWARGTCDKVEKHMTTRQDTCDKRLYVREGHFS